MRHPDNCECAKCFAAASNDCLRDDFASAALTGLIKVAQKGTQAATICKEAYLFADAMMKAREGK